jgi:hypothetical protein
MGLLFLLAKTKSKKGDQEKWGKSGLDIGFIQSVIF